MSAFDDLEIQLRRAVARRARQRSTVLRPLAVALALLVPAGGVAAATTVILGGEDRDRRAAALHTAIIRATEDVPGCRPLPTERGPARISAAAPSRTALDAYPVLRRPATEAERRAGRRYGRLTGSVVLAGGARELRAAGGDRFLLLITVGRPGRAFGPRDASCAAARLAALDRRASDEDPGVVRVVRRSLEAERAALRRSRGRESLVFASLRPDGGLAGAGGTSVDVAVRRGTGSIGVARVDDRQRGHVTGLVNAGVDHVVIRRRRAGGPAPVRRPVRDQVFSVLLPPGFGNRIAVDWRAADGRLLRTLNVRY